MTAPTDFVVDVDVRWSDMDAFSHVNHARTVTILEEARAAWLAAAPQPASSYRVRELHVRYQGQVRHADSPLRVVLFTQWWTEADVTVAYEVRTANADPGERPAVVARTVLVVGDPEDDTDGPSLSSADTAFVRSFARGTSERPQP